ncbi:TetR/AcrR family transcriptional regulator [Pseudoalteromonas sp. DL2-H2.2]|uniref:TetR/AcrR family transcriptional regulator n=1 Tax=Pseudoalteromonas sp. DL2-H2.2 TaxID=2908889 RepID=UPI001F18CB69|nr:TetR/AcrR family transcriptional regulator [Pseudoalteromonas sp. DL2-H2.2]MCF2909404.1 TetR/AcrR family transcriptional regulator [Pseudoalteromonas sp. DL2-H2.2]
MSDKRALLLNSALELFYEKGTATVGINEIIAHSGVAKKTLYHHFSSKEDLILAALSLRDQRYLQWLSERLTDADSNADLVRQLFNALNDWFNDRATELGHFRGCFFINTAGESATLNQLIADRCASHKVAVRRLITSSLPQPNDRLVDALCLLKEGATTSAFVQGDKQAALRCIDIALAFDAPAPFAV